MTIDSAVEARAVHYIGHIAVTMSKILPVNSFVDLLDEETAISRDGVMLRGCSDLASSKVGAIVKVGDMPFFEVEKRLPRRRGLRCRVITRRATPLTEHEQVTIEW